MKGRASKSKNYNVASIQESEKHESMMRREKRWTKAQRERERERERRTQTQRERERERERCIVYCDAHKYFYRQERVR